MYGHGQSSLLIIPMPNFTVISKYRRERSGVRARAQSNHARDTERVLSCM